MTVKEALELARSYSVEVRLNAGDGLNLEVEAAPPRPWLMSSIPPWDILAALRQQKAEARARLGLEPLADPLERHRPFLTTVEDSRPPDAHSGRWETAMRGLRAFLAAGHGDAVDRIGRPPDELYAVPPVWARVDLCGTPDYALVFSERLKLLARNVDPGEARLRAFEYIVMFCRNDRGVDLKSAKKLVTDAISAAKEKGSP